MSLPVSPSKVPYREGSPLYKRRKQDPIDELSGRISIHSSTDQTLIPRQFSGVAGQCEERAAHFPHLFKLKVIECIKQIMYYHCEQMQEIELALLLFYLGRDGTEAPLHCTSFIDHRIAEMHHEIHQITSQMHGLVDEDLRAQMPSAIQHYIFSALVRVIYTPAGTLNLRGVEAVQAILSHGINGYLPEEYQQHLKVFLDHMLKKPKLFSDLITQLEKTKLHHSMKDFIRIDWKTEPKSLITKTRLVWVVLMALARPCNQKNGNGCCFAVAAINVALRNQPHTVFEFIIKLLETGDMRVLPIAPQAVRCLTDANVLKSKVDGARLPEYDTIKHIYDMMDTPLRPPLIRKLFVFELFEESFQGRDLEWVKRLFSGFKHSALMQAVISAVMCSYLNATSQDSPKEFILKFLANEIGVDKQLLAPYFFFENVAPSSRYLVYCDKDEYTVLKSITTLQNRLERLFPHIKAKIFSRQVRENIESLVRSSFSNGSEIDEQAKDQRNSLAFRDSGGYADDCLRDCFQCPVQKKNAA